jgi:hypothetical protein
MINAVFLDFAFCIKSIVAPCLAAHKANLAFEVIFREFGIPLVIRCDNGSPFGSTGALGLTRLSAWWLKLGIRVEFIEAGHPEQNGGHEQMHRVYKAEILGLGWPGNSMMWMREEFGPWYIGKRGKERNDEKASSHSAPPRSGVPSSECNPCGEHVPSSGAIGYQSRSLPETVAFCEECLRFGGFADIFTVNYADYYSD